MTHLNANTISALSDYISHPEPGFAVLVAGPWGVGKTHLIKGFAKTVEGTEPPLMVNLFGVTSVDDIDSAIFTASLPKIDNQYISAAGRLAKTMLKFAPQQFADLGPKDFLKLKLPPVLIFDDLERTNLTPQEILGAINGFVEQDKKHVILLANEEKLFDGETSGEKEKVIGQTLTVVADIEAALSPMLGELGGDAKVFLTANRAMLISAFNTAGYGNLRSLAQVLWDFGRLYNALTPALQDKTEGMVELLKVFVALGLEVKKGVLGRGELEMRSAFFLKLNHSGHSPENQNSIERLSELDEKYKDWGLSNGRPPCVFTTALAVETLIDGNIGTKLQVNAISQTPLFTDKETEQEWQTVWWALQREPDEVENAFKEMKAKISCLAYVDPGIILHVYSSFPNLIEMGLETQTLDQIEISFRKYVDAVAQQGRLPMGDGLPDGYGYDDQVYMGLGYPHKDHPLRQRFNQMFDYVRGVQDNLFRASFSSQSGKLLEIMATDAGEAAALLRESEHSQNPYYRQPVLVDMDIAAFVKTLCELPSEDQTVIYRSLKNRFGTRWPDLEPERDWLELVIGALQAEADKATGVEQWQLQSRIDIFLRPHLITQTDEDQA